MSEQSRVSTSHPPSSMPRSLNSPAVAPTTLPAASAQAVTPTMPPDTQKFSRSGRSPDGAGTPKLTPAEKRHGYIELGLMGGGAVALGLGMTVLASMTVLPYVGAVALAVGLGMKLYDWGLVRGIDTDSMPDSP